MAKHAILRANILATNDLCAEFITTDLFIPIIIILSSTEFKLRLI